MLHKNKGEIDTNICSDTIIAFKSSIEVENMWNFQMISMNKVWVFDKACTMNKKYVLNNCIGQIPNSEPQNHTVCLQKKIKVTWLLLPNSYRFARSREGFLLTKWMVVLSENLTQTDYNTLYIYIFF